MMLSLALSAAVSRGPSISHTNGNLLFDFDPTEGAGDVIISRGQGGNNDIHLHELVQGSHAIIQNRDDFTVGETQQSEGSVTGTLASAVAASEADLQGKAQAIADEFTPDAFFQQDAEGRDRILENSKGQAIARAVSEGSSDLDRLKRDLRTAISKLRSETDLGRAKLDSAVRGVWSKTLSEQKYNLTQVSRGVRGIIQTQPRLNDQQGDALDSLIPTYSAQLSAMEAELTGTISTLTAIGTEAAQGVLPNKRLIWSGGCHYGQHSPSHRKYCFTRTDFNSMGNAYMAIPSDTVWVGKVAGFYRINVWIMSHARMSYAAIYVNGGQVSHGQDRHGNGAHSWSYWGDIRNDITVPLPANGKVEIDCDRTGGSWTWHSWNANGQHSRVQFEFVGYY
jgi:hypothetical protein